jgi:hypothetical protein
LYLDVSKALPESINVRFRDTEWIQTIDYEHIHFRCCKCHAHGHLFWDCPINKPSDQPKAQHEKDAKGFEKISSKRKILRETTPQPGPKGSQTSNNFEKLATIE